MARAFVSYSHLDKLQVKEIIDEIRKVSRIGQPKSDNRIEEENIIRDEDILEVGEEFPQLIEKGIENSKYIILFLSTESGASNWVNYEIGYALSRGKKLIPIKIEENCRIPEILKLKGIHVEEISPGNRDKWDVIVKNIVKQILPPESRLAFKDEIDNVWIEHFKSVINQDLDTDSNPASRERSIHDARIAQEIILNVYNKNNPPKVFGSRENDESEFTHRFWGLYDISEGDKKHTWITWDTVTDRLVILKEATSESYIRNEIDRTNIIRIQWEKYLLNKHSEVKSIPDIVENPDKSNWFALELLQQCDLEWQLFPGRHRNEDNPRNFVERKVFSQDLGKLSGKNGNQLLFSARDITTDARWHRLRDFFIKIGDLLIELHWRKMAHLDLLPSNILITKKQQEFVPYICDYDRAIHISIMGESQIPDFSSNFNSELKNVLNNLDGRSLADAHERFNFSDRYGSHRLDLEMLQKCDSYSFGALMAGILMRRPETFLEFPVDARKGEEGAQYYEDQHDALIQAIQSFDSLPRDVKALLTRILSLNPDERPTIQEINDSLKAITRWVPEKTAVMEELRQENERKAKEKETRRLDNERKMQKRRQQVLTRIAAGIAVLGLVATGFAIKDQIRYDVHDGGAYHNLEWNRDVLVNDHIFVTGTLSIQPGTTIYMSRGASITIALGGRINAAGTEELPIVFTSRKGSNTRVSGYWGGLTICGRAAEPGELEFFGSTPVPQGLDEYGAAVAVDDDDSGILSYVRIEYAGYDFLKDSGDARTAFNGLSLAGVGNNTKINNIWIYDSEDDGVEFYGSTVWLEGVIVELADDDGIDFENKFDRYSGIRNGFIYMSKESFVFEGRENYPGHYGIEGIYNILNDRSSPVRFDSITIQIFKDEPDPALKDSLSATLPLLTSIDWPSGAIITNIANRELMVYALSGNAVNTPQPVNRTDPQRIPPQYPEWVIERWPTYFD